MYENNRLLNIGGSSRDLDFIIQQKIIEFINNNNNYYESVLDYGAGNSPYRPYVPCKEYITADISQNSNMNIDHIINCDKLKIPDNNFDLILLLDVLEHVLNPVNVINELKRLLKPGGSLIVSVPFMYREHETPNDFVRYTSFGIKRLFESMGGTISRSEKVGNAYLTLLILFLERNIYNGEIYSGSRLSILINRILIKFFNLISPICSSNPSQDAGCYHHLLVEVTFLNDN